jgi:hypothetical protein
MVSAVIFISPRAAQRSGSRASRGPGGGLRGLTVPDISAPFALTHRKPLFQRFLEPGKAGALGQMQETEGTPNGVGSDPPRECPGGRLSFRGALKAMVTLLGLEKARY